jgi:hypothetical protein
MHRADALQLSDPRRAAELWTHIDHEIVNNAYSVTTVNGHETELVSKRLKNYQYSPVEDFIADQVWLRQPTSDQTTNRGAVLELLSVRATHERSNSSRGHRRVLGTGFGDRLEAFRGGSGLFEEGVQRVEEPAGLRGKR